MFRQTNLHITNRDIPVIIFLLASTIRLFLISQIVDFYDVDEFVNLSQGKYLARGWIPYVDFVSNHPPGIAILFSLPHLFFPQCWLGMRIFTAVIDSITSVLLYKIAMNIFDNRAAIITALLYIFNPIAIHTSILVMQEPYVLFFVIAAVYFLNSKNPRLAIAGLLIAASIFIKYLAILLLPAYFLIVKKEDRVKLFISIFTFMLLFFTPFILEISKIISQTIIFQTNRQEYSLASKVLNILIFGILFQPFAILGFGKIKKEHNWIYIGYLSMLSFFLLPRIYYHYFLLIVPFACLLSTKAIIFSAKILFKPFLQFLPIYPKPHLMLKNMTLSIIIILCFGLLIASFLSLLSNPIHLGTHKLSDIKEKESIIEFVENNTTVYDPILTDYSEYAYLTNRISLFGYFWNAKYSLNRDDLFSSLEKVKLVIVTRKYMYFNNSIQIFYNYPLDFVLHLDKNYHKAQFNETTIYLIQKEKINIRDETKT